MSLIKTKSFQLAIYARGNRNSPRLALVLPGKLDTKDYPHMRSHVDFLAKRGYFSLSFDPPGTWESPGDIKIYTTTNYLKAVDELIECFGNRKTFVVGHSRGGTAAILSGIRNPYITSFADLMGSFHCGTSNTAKGNRIWRNEEYQISRRDLPGGNPKVKTKEFLLPYSFHQDEVKYNSLSGLRGCLKPKLFVFGKNDLLIKPEVFEKAYKISASPKEIVALDSDHNYRIHPDLINQVNENLGKFLDKYDKNN